MEAGSGWPEEVGKVPSRCEQVWEEEDRKMSARCCVKVAGPSRCGEWQSTPEKVLAPFVRYASVAVIFLPKSHLQQ